MSYFVFQKIYGIGMILLCVFATWLGDGDATFAAIGVPLGIWMIFSKQKLLIIDEKEDKEPQK